jgi:hypothetical protein
VFAGKQAQPRVFSRGFAVPPPEPPKHQAEVKQAALTIGFSWPYCVSGSIFLKREIERVSTLIRQIADDTG